MGSGKKLSDKNGKAYAYLKYSGLAFQLAAVVFLGLWAGTKLDEYFASEQPYFTIFLVLGLFTAYMYKLYIDLIKKKE